MNKILKNILILTLITLVSGIGLGAVYEVTKEPIRQAGENAKQAAYQQVISDADSFEPYAEFDKDEAAAVLTDAGITGNTINEVAAAKKDGETIGYVITGTSSDGYGGDIQLSTGILSDGTITGIAFLSISETAGLGMNAEKPEFYEQFSNKQVEQFEVVKGGGSGGDNEIDALSGATITSAAVTDDVNAALAYFQNVLEGGSGNE